MATGAVVGVVAAVVGAAAGAIIAQSMMPAQQKGDYSAGTPKKGVDFALPIAYGRARVDSHFIFAETLNQPISQQTKDYVYNYLKSQWNYQGPAEQAAMNGFLSALFSNRGADTSGEYKTFIVGFGEGPINAFKQIYIDDVPLFGSDMDVRDGIVGWAQLSPEFRDHVQVEFSHGDRHDPYWLAMAGLNSDGKWTSAHRGFGRPLMCLKVKLDPKGRIKSEYFSVQAEVEGRLITDVRYNNAPEGYRDLGGKEFGRNPALVIHDYLSQSYGAGMLPFELDTGSFIQAANYCETNHLYCDGVVNQMQEPMKSIEELLSSFGGYLSLVNGIVGCVIDQPAVATYHYSTQDNIVKGTVQYEVNSIQDYFNQLEVTIKDQASGKTDIVLYPPKIDDATLKRDGKRITDRLELPFTKDKAAIDFLASRAFMRSRYADKIKFTADMDGFLVSVFDVIEVSVPEYNLTRKQFRVFKHEADFEKGVVQIEAVEYDPAIYSAHWTGIPTITNPNNPITVNPVDNLRTRIVEFNRGLSVQLEWDNNDASATDFDILFKLAADPDGMFKTMGSTKADSYLLFNIEPGYYDFAVVSRNIVGNTSRWAYLRNVDLKDDTVFPAVTNVRLVNRTAASSFQTNDRDFIIKWDSMQDEIVKSYDTQFIKFTHQKITVRDAMQHYAVDVYHGGNLKQTIISAIPECTYTFEQNKVNGLSRSVEFRVKIVGKGGATSPIGASSKLTVQNPQIAVPTGVEARGGIAGIFAKWIHPTDPDYAGTQVHMSKTPNYVPSATTLQVQPLADDFFFPLDERDTSVYYLKIGHYDIFGTSNINFTQEYVVSKKDVTDYMTNLKKDQLAKELIDELNDKVPRTEFNNVIKKEVGDVVISLNQDISTIIKPQIDDLQSKLTKEIGDRTTADASLSKQVQDGDKALSTRLDVVKASADKANSDIVKTNADVTSVKSAYAAADTALSTKIDTVAATTAKNAGDALSAAIKTEQTARTAGDTAIANQVTALDAAYKKADADLKADYTQQITVVSNETKQLASRVETVKVEAKAEAITAANTYTDGKVSAGDAATLNAAKTAIASGDAATLKAATDKAAALSDQAEKDAIAEAAKRDAATLVSAKAEVTNEANARQKADEVIANDVKNLRSETTSKANALEAKINIANTTVTDLQKSTATSISTLTSTVNGMNATVKTTAETTADINNKLKSKYVLQVNAGGVVSGFGLIADAATNQSAIMFTADKLIFTNDNGKTGYPLFEVNSNGTLIRRALIGELEAGNIAAGAIRTHHCQANMITANSAIIQDGAITNAKIGNIIQSVNYNPGSAGWKIDKSGYAEFRNVNVSGTITGSYITGSVVEGALMITNTSGVPMTPTEADGWGGVRYLCKPYMDLSITSPQSHGSVIRTNPQNIVAFNYDAAGNESYTGGVIARKNFDRFRRRQWTYSSSGSAWFDRSPSVLHKTIQIRSWLLATGDAGLGYKDTGAFGIGTGVADTWSGIGWSKVNPPAVPNWSGTINGVNVTVQREYVLVSQNSYGAPNFDHNNGHGYGASQQQYHYSLSAVAVWFNYSNTANFAGNQAQVYGQTAITTNKQGDSWGAGGYVHMNEIPFSTKNVNT